MSGRLELKVREMIVNRWTPGSFAAEVSFGELLDFAKAVDDEIAAAKLGVNVTIGRGVDCSGLTIKGGDAG